MRCARRHARRATGAMHDRNGLLLLATRLMLVPHHPAIIVVTICGYAHSRNPIPPKLSTYETGTRVRYAHLSQ